MIEESYDEETKGELDEFNRSWVDYMKISGRVLKDKCWYTLWNFDLFSKVNRIYPNEGYYSTFYHLLMIDADKITPHIYLGSGFNAADYSWLKGNNIQCIINATPCIGNYFPDDFTYYNYSTTDLNNSSLKGFYETAYRTLNENIAQDKKFLVHCYAGKSRSAALVLYYLMKEYNWSLPRALKHIKRSRPCINVNCSFIDEIKELLPNQVEDNGESDDI
jgi:hypothetical protein